MTSITADRRVLDVSRLDPPEPLVRILEAIEHLPPGEYLHIRHRREPYPLYAILEESGFAHLTRLGRDCPYEIFIWRRGDERARASVQLLVENEIQGRSE